MYVTRTTDIYQVSGTQKLPECSDFTLDFFYCKKYWLQKNILLVTHIPKIKLNCSTVVAAIGQTSFH